MNVEVQRFGEPLVPDFEIPYHTKIMESFDGIDMDSAMRIGMLPKQPIEKYKYIGNSSLTGACAMLISDEATEKVFELGRNTTYMELSTEPRYMNEFVAACFIPHTDASLFD